MEECKSLEDIRLNIDTIDREIIKLLSERAQYVKQAAKLKKTSHDVKAPKRFEEVISKVRKLAVEFEVDSNIVEKVYRTMIESFINIELKEHAKIKEYNSE